MAVVEGVCERVTDLNTETPERFVFPRKYLLGTHYFLCSVTAFDGNECTT